jgi:phage gpG-like protein
MAVSIKLDEQKLRDVKARLKSQIDVMKNLNTPLSKIATNLYQSVMQNFREGGTDKEKWRPLAMFTLFVKSHRKEKQTKKPLLLQDTGYMRMSIVPVVGDNFAQVGTNVPYAKLHQFGGMSEPNSVRIASFWRRRPSTGEQDVRVHEYTMNIRRHRVPARPFLTIREQHKQRIMGIVRSWFRGQG